MPLQAEFDGTIKSKEEIEVDLRGKLEAEINSGHLTGNGTYLPIPTRPTLVNSFAVFAVEAGGTGKWTCMCDYMLMSDTGNSLCGGELTLQ